MYGLNRTLCDVLADMRRLLDTGVIPIPTMKSLVEEVQCMANRMEAGLYDLKDREMLLKEIKSLRAKKKKLKAQVEPPTEESEDKLFSTWNGIFD